VGNTWPGVGLAGVVMTIGGKSYTSDAAGLIQAKVAKNGARTFQITKMPAGYIVHPVFAHPVPVPVTDKDVWSLVEATKPR
jgi:hypothetical protein